MYTLDSLFCMYIWMYYFQNIWNESVCITCMYFFGMFILLCLWMSQFVCFWVFFPLFICMSMGVLFEYALRVRVVVSFLHVYTVIYLEELLVLSWVLFNLYAFEYSFHCLFVCLWVYCLSMPWELEWWFHCLHVYTIIYLEELLVLSWVLFSIPSLFAFSLFALCVYSLRILVYGYCLLVCVWMYFLLYLYKCYSLVF